MDENWNPADSKDNGLMAQGFLSETFYSDMLTIKTEPLTDTYTMEARPFARGKFATVRRCRHKATGQDFAAKCIRKRRRAADVRHEILHEVCVLKLTAANCKNRIVRLHEVFETPTEVILVLEFVSGGELQRLIDDEVSICETDVIRLMRQILEGLSYLHERNIAHLDIKPQNILLTTSYPHCDVKLCDFGISRVITKGVEIREIVGTPDYVAPEILHYEPINLSTDMWSVGILAYVMLSGHTPFGGETKQETFCNITDGHLEFPKDIFEGVSNDAKDFIRRLLVRDASERMTVKDCLKHTWLSCRGPSEVNASQEASTALILSSPPPDDNATASPNLSKQRNRPGDHHHNHQRNKCDNDQNNLKSVGGGDLHRVDHPSIHRRHDNKETDDEESSPKVQQQATTTTTALNTIDSTSKSQVESNDKELSAKPAKLEGEKTSTPVVVVPFETVVEEANRDVAVPLSQMENRLEEHALRHHVDDEPANKRAIHILPDLKLRRERSTTPTPNKESTQHHSSQHHHLHSSTVHHVSCTTTSSGVERQTMKTKSEMVEFEGLTLSKRLIFSEEMLVDERMGMVY